MSANFTEPVVEEAKRVDYGRVVARRLRDALARLNPALLAEALSDAFRKLTRPEGADLIQRNRALHRLLQTYVALRNIYCQFAAISGLRVVW